MYGKHPNGGMTEIDSRNVDFLKNEFPTIGEVKKHVQLLELQQNTQPSFNEGENLDSNQVTEDGMPPISEGNGGDLPAQENEVSPQSPVLEHAVGPHVQDPTPQRDSGSNSPHAQGPTPLRERGRDTSTRQTNNEGPRLRRSERGRIPRRYFQIEEEIFLCTPLEVEEPTSNQEAIDSPSHKE